MNILLCLMVRIYNYVELKKELINFGYRFKPNLTQRFYFIVTFTGEKIV